MLKTLVLLLMSLGQYDCGPLPEVGNGAADRIDLSEVIWVASSEVTPPGSLNPPACSAFRSLTDSWLPLTGHDELIWLRFRATNALSGNADRVLYLPMPGAPTVCVHWPVQDGTRQECLNQAVSSQSVHGTWFAIPEDLDSRRAIHVSMERVQHMPYGYWLIETRQFVEAVQTQQSLVVFGVGFVIAIGMLLMVASYSRRKLFLVNLSAFCIVSATTLLGLSPGGLGAHGLHSPQLTEIIPMVSLTLLLFFYGNFLHTYMKHRGELESRQRLLLTIRAAFLTAFLVLIAVSVTLAARVVPWLLVIECCFLLWLLGVQAIRGKRTAAYLLSSTALLLLGMFLWSISALVGSSSNASLGLVIVLCGWLLLILCLVFEFGEQVRAMSRERSSHSATLMAEHGLSVLRSSYCQITGLPLRPKLTELFQRLAEGCTAKTHQIGVFLIQIDRLIDLRRRYGRQTQLDVLAELSGRFRHGLEGQQITGRLENLEFLIAIPYQGNDEGIRQQVSESARNILLSIEEPLSIDGELIELRANLGVAIWPRHAQRFESLLTCCDSALYEVVKSGGGSFRIYDDQIDAWRSAQLTRVDELQEAIDSAQLALYYQPIVNSETGAVYGAEALIRWLHPQRGLVFPDEFLSVAKDNQLIIDIGFWSLSAVFSDLKRFADQQLPPFPVSINFTPAQFAHKGLINQLCYYIDHTDVDPSCLRVEITEDSLIENLDHARRTISRLSQAGVVVYIDDFGVGYSSLNYLRALPIFGLKIDQSFVSNIGHANQDEEVIKAIIRLARSLDLFLVAEGVETQHQQEFLIEHDVRALQGFLYSRAIPVEEFMAFVNERDVYQPEVHRLDASGA